MADTTGLYRMFGSRINELSDSRDDPVRRLGEGSLKRRTVPEIDGDIFFATEHIMRAASTLPRQELRAKELVNPCSHLQFGLCSAFQYVAAGRLFDFASPIRWNILSNPRTNISYPGQDAVDLGSGIWDSIPK